MIINIIRIVVNNILTIVDILIVSRNRLTHNKNVLCVTGLINSRRMLPTNSQCLPRKKLIHPFKGWLL